MKSSLLYDGNSFFLKIEGADMEEKKMLGVLKTLFRWDCDVQKNMSPVVFTKLIYANVYTDSGDPSGIVIEMQRDKSS